MVEASSQKCDGSLATTVYHAEAVEQICKAGRALLSPRPGGPPLLRYPRARTATSQDVRFPSVLRVQLRRSLPSRAARGNPEHRSPERNQERPEQVCGVDSVAARQVEQSRTVLLVEADDKCAHDERDQCQPPCHRI